MDLTADSTPLLVEYMMALGMDRTDVMVTVWGEMMGDQLQVYKIQDAIRTGMCHMYMDAIKPRGGASMTGTTMTNLARATAKYLSDRRNASQGGSPQEHAEQKLRKSRSESLDSMSPSPQFHLA
eukprot:gene473-1881_t